MSDDRWHQRGSGWERDDGVFVARVHPDDYVWKAVRPLPDSQGRWAVEIEGANVFVVMDEVDALWPI